MFYILGLGNPETTYVGTRHNIGRDALFTLANTLQLPSWSKNKNANALETQGFIATAHVEYLLPETYMNRSGETASYLMKKRGAQPTEIVVVYDDVALPIGEIKVSVGRGDGGHNGIKSIEQALGSRDFVRVRVGVASKSFWTGKTIRPQGGVALQKHVLGKFTKAEQKVLLKVQKDIERAIELLVEKGVAGAMNEVN